MSVLGAAGQTPETTSALARAVIERLAARGQTLAVAESLTGGLLAARLVDVPGASAVFRGGVVAYATELKHTVLGVDDALLDRYGAVHPQVAVQMATGVRDLLGATWGLSTTGVAGPEPQDGHPVGTVFLGLAGPGKVAARSLARGTGTLVPGDNGPLRGERARIRAATVDGALAFLLG